MQAALARLRPEQQTISKLFTCQEGPRSRCNRLSNKHKQTGTHSCHFALTVAVKRPGPAGLAKQNLSYVQTMDWVN